MNNCLANPDRLEHILQHLQDYFLLALYYGKWIRRRDTCTKEAVSALLDADIYPGHLLNALQIIDPVS